MTLKRKPTIDGLADDVQHAYQLLDMQSQRLGALEASLQGVLEQGAKADKALEAVDELGAYVDECAGIFNENVDIANEREAENTRIQEIDGTLAELTSARLSNLDARIDQVERLRVIDRQYDAPRRASLASRLAAIERENELSAEISSTFWSRLSWLLTGY